MIQDEELAQLLREAVDELSAGATVPSGLAARAARRYRRRIFAPHRAGRLAVAVAAAAAVALTIGLIKTVADLGSRTQRPTVQASRRIDWPPPSRRVEILETVTTLGSPNEYPRRILVSDGQENVYELETLAGSPILTVWTESVSHGTVQVVVNYRAKTWWRISNSSPLPPHWRTLPPWSLPPAQTDFIVLPAPGHGCGLPDVSPGDPGNHLLIGGAMQCGALQRAGRQRIDGTQAIKLVPGIPQTHLHPGPVHEALWVNPSTYQPLRVAWSSPVVSSVSDFFYLRPTSARRALLRPVIPRGFRQLY